MWHYSAVCCFLILKTKSLETSTPTVTSLQEQRSSFLKPVSAMAFVAIITKIAKDAYNDNTI